MPGGAIVNTGDTPLRFFAFGAPAETPETAGRGAPGGVDGVLTGHAGHTAAWPGAAGWNPRPHGTIVPWD